MKTKCTRARRSRTLPKTVRETPTLIVNIAHVTECTPLCQMWIDFEEGTWVIHIVFPILELGKNVTPKLDHLVVHIAGYNPVDRTENVKEVVSMEW